MTIRILHNPRCSTSRKALELLRSNGHEPEIVEYLKTPPDRDELARLYAAADLLPSEAVRRKEPLFAELGLALASEDAILEAMVENPILIERPVVETPKGVRIGRPPERVLEIL